jgi:hypothetical protein
MLNPEENKLIADAATQLTHEIKIRLIATDDDKRDEFETYCALLAELTPKIHIKKEFEPSHQPPAIGLEPSILLHALPQGTELQPFVDLLIAESKRTKTTQNETLEDNLEIPAALKLFVSPACPFCPLMMKKLFEAALAHPAIHLTVIDVSLFPEIAELDQVKSVPTLILDNGFRWTGSVDMEELFEVIHHRDPAILSTDSLKSMIANGDAFQLAELMIRERIIFPAFFDLLTHEEFSTRLGAMAAVETLVEKDRDIAAQLIDPLLLRFEDQIEQVKGDILYILGEVGDYRLISFLKSIAVGKYANDIKEAATDAIDHISAK